MILIFRSLIMFELPAGKLGLTMKYNLKVENEVTFYRIFLCKADAEKNRRLNSALLTSPARFEFQTLLMLMAVFILQTNYPSRRIMRRTFNATSIKTGRTRRQRKVGVSLS